MTNNLILALIQSNIIWENPVENRLRLSEKIENISETTNVIILPEMFTTGFTMNAKMYAETMQGETVKWMLDIAKNKNAAITGSLIITEDNKYYNRLLFVFPNGKIETYNKRHTFTLAGENKIYQAGNKKIIVKYKQWQIALFICYDLRFPVWARNTCNYDALLYVANWPKQRITAWNALLKARAIENMSYTIGVNRVGIDANNHEYPGHSAVYNVLGESITALKPNTEAIQIVTLLKEHIIKNRNKLGFLNDKDTFNLVM